MKYTAKNIEFFIITRNRANLLERTLKSVLMQTVQDFPIFILDNSTDNKTEELIKSKYQLIQYIRTKQIPLANLKTLQEVASKTFFVLLHDDDLIHPQYIGKILKILNKESNIDLIAPSSIDFDDINRINFTEQLSNQILVFEDKNLFASYTHNLAPNWSGSLTRTANFKQIDLNENDKLYGKIGDVPLMIKSIISGKAVIIPNPSGFYYYHHPGQDTNDERNKITIKQFENYLTFYKSYIQGKYTKDCYAFYLLGFSRHINHYKWFVKNTVPYDIFITDMCKKGIIDRKILLYSKRYYGPIYKILTLPLKIFYGLSLYKIEHQTKDI